MTITLHQQTLLLLPERALFWKEQGILLVADTHFGKSGTFRQEGIPVPGGTDAQGFNRLDTLMAQTDARRCIILGDFFHSVMNAEWEAVRRWGLDWEKRGTPLELVPGNHDILHASDYVDAGLILHEDVLQIGPFRLQHAPPAVDEAVAGRARQHPAENTSKASIGNRHHARITSHTNLSNQHPPQTESNTSNDTGSSGQHGTPPEPYTLSGHLHPGITLSGKGRQRLRLPCFWFGAQTGILPAFGAFTGLADIQPRQGDQIFATTIIRHTPTESGTIVPINL